MSTVKKRVGDFDGSFRTFSLFFFFFYRQGNRDRVQKQKIHLQVFYSDYLYICVGSFLYFSFVHTLSLSTCVYVHFYIRYWSLGEERSSSFQTQTLTRPWLPSRREGMESISRRNEPNITNDLGLDMCWCNRLSIDTFLPCFWPLLPMRFDRNSFKKSISQTERPKKEKWNKK
jgi:hypothetical protein